jgi:hypothetical protein
MDKQFQNPLLSLGSLVLIQKYRIQSHKASAVLGSKQYKLSFETMQLFLQTLCNHLTHF